MNRWILLHLVVCTFAAQTTALDYRISWLGNSFSGSDAWVLQDVTDIHVTPGGTLFTNVFWEEHGGNQQEYYDGAFITYAKYSHGWGKQGGNAVCANRTHLYFSQRWDNEGGGLYDSYGIENFPPTGYHWWGVSRRNRSNIQTGTPFDGGKGGKESPVGSFLVVHQLPTDQKGTLGGLYATETELFAACPYDDTIRVYDANSMALLRAWPAVDPLDLCQDTAGDIWAIAGPERSVLHCYSPAGTKRTVEITLPEHAVAADACIDKDNRLYVADRGPANIVLIYEGLSSSPALVDRFGETGGIFSGTRGAFGDSKLNGPEGVGVDSSGNLYVASSGSCCGGSTVIESYAPGGSLSWRVLGLQFVDLPSIDPEAEGHVFTKEEHYTLDYTRSNGGEWRYQGYTIDRQRYPDDPRLHLGGTNGWVRRIGGRRILFVTRMASSSFQVYRFDPVSGGEIAIPSGLFTARHITKDDDWPPFQPAQNEWLWRDRNGNGVFDDGEYQSGPLGNGGYPVPDRAGAIWQTVHGGIRCLPLLGMDTHGNPMWDFDSAHIYPIPAEFDKVRRVYYQSESDVMLLGGNRGHDTNQHWKPMGPVLARYDNFTTNTPTLRWNVVLPYETGSSGHESREPMSIDVAGEYVFVAYTRGLTAENLRDAFVKVYRLDNAAFVGNLTHESVLGKTGLLDLAESVSAHQRENGEYIVLLEDDAKGKTVMYRWCPTGDCSETGTAGPDCGEQFSTSSAPGARAKAGSACMYTLDGRRALSSGAKAGDTHALWEYLPAGMYVLRRNEGASLHIRVPFIARRE